MVLKLTGSMERGNSCEAYQSVPVEAKMDGKTTVEIYFNRKKTGLERRRVHDKKNDG